ncbi:MAG: FAD-dependent oxidoreductase [Rubrobacteraceae bacterium]
MEEFGQSSERDRSRTASSRRGGYGTKPVLFAVDSGSRTFRQIQHELRKRYGGDYQLMSESSAGWSLKRLRELKEAGEEVALVIADQWMPDMSGTELLARVRQIFPTAKRALLSSWGDSTTREPILQAMTLGHIDYYINKPEYPGDEHFHRMISEFLYDWSKAYRTGFHEIRVVGARLSARSHELRDILKRNGVLHAFYEADSEEGGELLAEVGQTGASLPVAVFPDGRVLVEPTNVEIADAFAVNRPLEQREFDLVVVGAGPAGLAAAVYGASEGLSTLVLEGEAIGGQAGTSSLIRNYLGFPWGVGGADLARRAAEQALWFGTVFRFMRHATGLRREGKNLVLMLSDDTEVKSRAVVLATGASYRRLGVPDLEALIGAGVFYGAATSEAPAVQGQDAYVVGGANSAGQAAMHLSKYASRVTLLVRSGTLTKSMSAYLIKEIEAAPNIDVRYNTQIMGGGGEGRLEELVLEDRVSGLSETVPAAALFVLIGAEPRTGWLPGEIVHDARGFVVTGQDLIRDGSQLEGWPLNRQPLLLETSMPGVFAVGDVRHRSVKRVASAVGEGSIAIQLVHEYFIKDRLGFATEEPQQDQDSASGDKPASGRTGERPTSET